MILYRGGGIKIFTNVDGKLVESKVITIAPKGLKDYIVGRFNAGILINDNQVIKLMERVFSMEKAIINGTCLDDEEIFTFVRFVELQLWKEDTVLSDIARAIFYLGDSSSQNKMMVLGQVRSALDITLIEIMKNKLRTNRRGSLDADKL